MLDVTLNCFLIIGSSNDALHIKHCVLRIAGQLIFGSISDQTFTFGGEGNVRRSNAVTLIICNDFHATALEDTNTSKKNKNFNNDLLKE